MPLQNMLLEEQIAEAGAPDPNGTLTDPRATRTWFYDKGRGSTLRIEAEQAWDDYTGAGVKVAVLDSQVDFTHDDLTPNYNFNDDLDLTTNSTEVVINPAALPNNHGTLVAGVIAAAANNGIGSAGVAHGATVAGLGLNYSSPNSVEQAMAGLRASTAFDVVNCSWSFTKAFEDDFRLKPTWGDALAQPVENGRDGLGTIVVFSAGNSALQVPSNTHNFQNSPYSIAVGAIDPTGQASAFTSIGYNVLVSAPGRAVQTTNLRDSYSNATGTSFSAPVVSGVAALVLEANEDLGYRDVQQILALSANRVGLSATPQGNGWQENGVNNVNGGGMFYSDAYGYGMVNAFDAVRLAETWTEQQTAANRSTLVEREFVAASEQAMTAGGRDTYQVLVDVNQDIDVEHVQLSLDLRWLGTADLEVFLTSPQGTRSQLMYDIAATGGVGSIRHFNFSTVANMGENGRGVWTVDVINKNDALTDRKTGLPMTGVFEGVTLTVHGDTQNLDNDTYFYTDAFGRGEGSSVLNDTAGVNTLNAALVDGAVQVALDGQFATSIAGRVLSITSGSVQNIFGGIGNDTLAGDDRANVIAAGRGSDTLHFTEGNDTLSGGQGQDTFLTALTLGEFSGEVLDTDTIILRHNSFEATVSEVETFQFSGSVMTFTDLASWFTPAAAGTDTFLIV